MRTLASLLRSDRGSAAAEMALVLPLMLVLLFGVMELGNYFLDEHVVVKAVRDGARFASRQTIDNYISSDSGCQVAPPAAVATAIKNVVRTGTDDASGPNRLSYWTDNSTITVTSACVLTAGSQQMKGIYDDNGAPVVTITAAVPYASLFGLYAFPSSVTLNASQQAAATGA